MKQKLMRACLTAGPGLLLVACSPAAGEQANAAAPATMLPARLIDCTLGRATNLDTKKNQTVADIIYEGAHHFSFYLPAIPARQGPPPDATEPADPVDPRTTIVSDADGLTAKFPNRFDRVVDLWPERVEMTTTIDDPLVNLLILSSIDPQRKTARLFMTQATDVATFDMKHIYEGACRVVENPDDALVRQDSVTKPKG